MSRRTRAAVAALALLAAGAAIDGARLARVRNWNTAIESGRLPPEGAGLPAEMRFAQAAALAAAGEDDAALDRYRTLQDDPAAAAALAQAARFNGANLLLRRAIAVHATNQPGQAIPLIELAKEGYREVLRRDPDHWDARYNLERAQRLLPDADESDAPPAATPENAERAATTMRGVSPGLP